MTALERILVERALAAYKPADPAAFTVQEARRYLDARARAACDAPSPSRPRWTLTDIRAVKALLAGDST